MLFLRTLINVNARGGGVLGLFFDGDVPLELSNPYPFLRAIYQKKGPISKDFSKKGPISKDFSENRDPYLRI